MVEGQKGKSVLHLEEDGGGVLEPGRRGRGHGQRKAVRKWRCVPELWSHGGSVIAGIEGKLHAMDNKILSLLIFLIKVLGSFHFTQHIIQ